MLHWRPSSRPLGAVDGRKGPSRFSKCPVRRKPGQAEASLQQDLAHSAAPHDPAFVLVAGLAWMHAESLDGGHQTCKGMGPEASSLQLLTGCRVEAVKAWHSVLEEPLL